MSSLKKDKIKKPKAILLGPIISEFFWEVGRFACMLPYLRRKYKRQNVKFIILTRQENFDLYGAYANIFLPLKIEGDYIKYAPNCFRLNNFPQDQYEKIAVNFKTKYKKNYNIIEHLYPKIDKKNFLRKNQFSQNQMIFDFKPRKENYEFVEEYFSVNKKPIIVIAPRYRKGFKRNWPYWKNLYDIIWKNKLQEKFNFVICGKTGEYIPDKENRFYDINHIKLSDNSSLAGLLIATLQRAMFTLGSQSAIPNLSLLLKVPVLSWGDQKALHTKTYNIKNTPIEFLEDRNYNLSHEQIFKHLIKQLKGK